MYSLRIKTRPHTEENILLCNVSYLFKLTINPHSPQLWHELITISLMTFQYGSNGAECQYAKTCLSISVTHVPKGVIWALGKVSIQVSRTLNIRKFKLNNTYKLGVYYPYPRYKKQSKATTRYFLSKVNLSNRIAYFWVSFRIFFRNICNRWA